MTAIERKATTFDDVIDNPHNYNMPTMEEFRQNPDKWRAKWRGREDDVFSSADAGSKMGLASRVKTHKYEIFGYQTKKLEEVERIARQEGLELNALDFAPECIPLPGGDCDMLIKFMTKDEKRRRDAK